MKPIKKQLIAKVGEVFQGKKLTVKELKGYVRKDPDLYYENRKLYRVFEWGK